jgi:hypothetical protein
VPGVANRESSGPGPPVTLRRCPAGGARTADGTPPRPARAVLTVVDRLAGSRPLDGVPPPPRSGLRRRQLVELLPLLGRHEHHRPVSRAHERHRPWASLNLLSDPGERVGLVQGLAAHVLSVALRDSMRHAAALAGAPLRRCAV